jgi:uroporphyrin-III C-methyltransferase
MSTTHTLELGKVFLVGAGPGAADLITLRGARLLAQADIVFHDALVDPTMLELCPQATKVAVGKRCGKLSSAQHFINKRLVDAVKKHQIIIRLKGGDNPSKSGHAPLAQPNADTLVYYMGRKDATSIAKQLIEGDTKHDDMTPVHILEAVSTKNERHWSSTLAQLANGEANEWFNAASPALIMIGEALRQKPRVLPSKLDGFCSVLNDGLQNSLVLTNRRRSA